MMKLKLKKPGFYDNFDMEPKMLAKKPGFSTLERSLLTKPNYQNVLRYMNSTH